jgi:hypothetical protein
MEQQRMTFGKYKGQPVADVIQQNPRYALWAHRNVEFFKLSASQIQDCVSRSDAPRFLPRSPIDDDDDGADEYAGMSYSDFGNN